MAMPEQRMPERDWTDEDRLVAEQAILLRREVMQAMEQAPHGHGLEVTEAAVMQGGRAFLRRLLEQALSAHSEAQKGGFALGRAPAGKKRRSRSTRRRG
jgi:hypothetical protein